MTNATQDTATTTATAAEAEKREQRERNLWVANEIRRQIGPRALFMLGAHTLLAGHESLQFGIRGCRTINRVRISLTPLDVYRVEFEKVTQRGMRIVTVSTHDDVYCDQLHDLIEAQTGLYTSL